MMNREG